MITLYKILAHESGRNGGEKEFLASDGNSMNWILHLLYQFLQLRVNLVRYNYLIISRAIKGKNVFLFNVSEKRLTENYTKSGT